MLKANNDKIIPTRILYIEDEVLIAMAQKMKLEQLGYQVTHVTTGEQALQTIEQDPGFNLVLSDIDLGKGFDGPTSVQKILEKFDIPAIFFSSHSEPEIVSRVEGITNYGYVMKSSGEFILNQSIKSALKLFASEKKYATAFDLNPDSININRLSDGKYLIINKGFTEILGFTGDDVIGRPSTAPELNIWNDPADRQRLVEQLRQNGTVEDLQAWFRCKDGSLRYGSMYARVITWNNEPAIMSITHDITSLKRQQDEITKLQADHQNLVENINEVVYFVDLQGSFSYVSPAIERISGYSKADLDSKNFSEFVYPADLDYLVERMKRAYQGEYLENEFRVIDKDGEIKWVRTSNRVRLENGKPVGLTGTMFDITDRIEAQQQRDALLVEKDLLLKETHHRIKNNMATIASLLSLRAGYTENPETKHALQEVQKRVNSMTVLYETLFNSEQVGKVSSKIFFDHLIKDIISIFPGNNRVNIEENIEDIYLESKPASSLGIIINEIITNIMKYAFPEIDSSSENPLIKITFLPEGTEKIVLEVEDNGVGFPDDFDISKTEGFGTKLLYLMTQQMGGDITINSQKGKKSSFKIVFDKNIL